MNICKYIFCNDNNENYLFKIMYIVHLPIFLAIKELDRFGRDINIALRLKYLKSLLGMLFRVP